MDYSLAQLLFGVNESDRNLSQLVIAFPFGDGFFRWNLIKIHEMNENFENKIVKKKSFVMICVLNSPPPANLVCDEDSYDKQ